jgi:hypothetical protein
LAATFNKVALLLAVALAAPAESATRSPAVKAEFRRLHPCPSTGKTRGACPGWEVEHSVPLCLGGPAVDTYSNLRWMRVEDHKRKTRKDVKLCRFEAQKSEPIPPL